MNSDTDLLPLDFDFTNYCPIINRPTIKILRKKHPQWTWQVERSYFGSVNYKGTKEGREVDVRGYAGFESDGDSITWYVKEKQRQTELFETWSNKEGDGTMITVILSGGDFGGEEREVKEDDTAITAETDTHVFTYRIDTDKKGKRTATLVACEEK